MPEDRVPTDSGSRGGQTETVYVDYIQAARHASNLDSPVEVDDVEMKDGVVRVTFRERGPENRRVCTDGGHPADEGPAILSKWAARLTGLTLIDRVVHFIKQAGSPSEKSFSRNGFLSYHAETHAVGAGIGVGYLALVSGDLRVLGAMLSLAIYGNAGEQVFEPRLLGDIRQERHYFLGGLVTGALLGVGTRMLLGLGLPTAAVGEVAEYV